MFFVVVIFCFCDVDERKMMKKEAKNDKNSKTTSNAARTFLTARHLSNDRILQYEGQTNDKNSLRLASYWSQTDLDRENDRDDPKILGHR
jgi:hypothetical protein